MHTPSGSRAHICEGNGLRAGASYSGLRARPQRTTPRATDGRWWTPFARLTRDTNWRPTATPDDLANLSGRAVLLQFFNRR